MKKNKKDFFKKTKLSFGNNFNVFHRILIRSFLVLISTIISLIFMIESSIDGNVVIAVVCGILFVIGLSGLFLEKKDYHKTLERVVETKIEDNNKKIYNANKEIIKQNKLKQDQEYYINKKNLKTKNQTNEKNTF